MCIRDRRLTVRGAEDRPAEGDEVVELLGADERGARAKTAVAGPQLLGDDDVGGHGRQPTFASSEDVGLLMVSGSPQSVAMSSASAPFCVKDILRMRSSSSSHTS